eukprot:6412215-Ditylum_brightwellii.AAC.1
MPHSKPSRNLEQPYYVKACSRQQKTQLAPILQKLPTCTAPLTTFSHTNHVMFNGIITIATDGSVLNKKGYFATVLHTDQQQLWFQGPCDGASSLMTS